MNKKIKNFKELYELYCSGEYKQVLFFEKKDSYVWIKADAEPVARISAGTDGIGFYTKRGLKRAILDQLPKPTEIREEDPKKENKEVVLNDGEKMYNVLLLPLINDSNDTYGYRYLFFPERPVSIKDIEVMRGTRTYRDFEKDGGWFAKMDYEDVPQSSDVWNQRIIHICDDLDEAMEIYMNDGRR